MSITTPQTVLMSTLLAVSINMASAEERLLPMGSMQVEDGDTVLIELDGDELRIQLEGIDAPENEDNPKLQRDMERTGLAQAKLLSLGRMAKEYLRRVIEVGKPHTLHYEPNKRDRYGRIPGEVKDTTGRSISAQVIKGGYAIASARSAPERANEYKALQTEAMNASQGLWQLEAEAARLWAGTESSAANN